MKAFSFVFSLVFLIASVGVSQKAHAEERNAQVGYLMRQFGAAVRGNHQPSAFVRSYEGQARAYTYDQALAVMVFTHAGERESARKILNALWNSQSPSGAFRFSYPVDDSNEISGAISWVVMAVNAYQAKFSSPEFEAMARAALEHLAAQTVELEYEGLASRAVRFAARDDRRTPWNETQVVSFEHNLDAYSAFSQYSGKGSEKFSALAVSIRRFLESMWTGDHFHAGYNLEQQRPNTDELYLDTQTWGVLALGIKGSRGESYVSGLDLSCEEFTATVRHGQKNVFGFFDYRPVNGLPPEAFVWSEGTAGALLALAEAGRDSCDGHRRIELSTTLQAMTSPSGGVAYATSNSRDFSTRSSVAGTAWAYLAQKGVNPFRMPETWVRLRTQLAAARR